MGTYTLVILDYGEKLCNAKNCQNIAKQYRVIVKDNSAKVLKYCWKHIDLLESEQK